jgi:hypothetical protein
MDQKETPTPANITVEFCSDLNYLDGILRLPEIYGRMSNDDSPGIGVISVAGLLANRRNVFLKVSLSGEPVGFFMLVWKGPGLYEVHTNLTENARGLEGVRVGRAARDFFFIHTDACRISSQCPDYVPESLVFARSVGFKTDFRRENAYTKASQKHGVTFVSTALTEWVRDVWKKPAHLDIGRYFHKQLFSVLEDGQHDDDDNHDGMVGLAAMIAVRGGQPEKAELIYNQWALCSGFAPLEYLGYKNGSLIFDIQTAILSLDQNFQIRVIKKIPCPQQPQ